jgi:hypothetical protein
LRRAVARSRQSARSAGTPTEGSFIGKGRPEDRPWEQLTGGGCDPHARRSVLTIRRESGFVCPSTEGEGRSGPKNFPQRGAGVSRVVFPSRGDPSSYRRLRTGSELPRHLVCRPLR